MRILLPELLLLALPAALLWRYLQARSRAVAVLRACIVGVLLLCACGLAVRRGAPGSDLIVIADRSASVPEKEKLRQEEILRILSARRSAGDRLGCVLFGRSASLACPPREKEEVTVGSEPVDPEGSDLAAAISLAVASIPPGRAARLLILSDGLWTGQPPVEAAAEAQSRGIPVDFRWQGSAATTDCALEDLIVPSSVPQRTVFPVTVSVLSSRAAAGTLTLTRNGKLVGTYPVSLRRGLTQIHFQDIASGSGTLTYRAALKVPDDRRPENNRAVGAVRTEAPQQVLLVNANASEDDLSEALRGGGLSVALSSPETVPVSLAQLTAFSAVVLENVPLTEFPPGAAGLLRRFVTELGGGLLLTGGPHCFGPGGYYRSALDEILPVSMELKEENRAFSIAMVIALDRSGSMAMTVQRGLQKMDLANAGACAAIELLSAFDQVAVVAVDSQAHLIVPLGEVSDKQAIFAKVRSIEAMGGGIMTDEALRAAAALLSRTDRSTRHLVLFADAADAEETQPGRCRTLIEPIRQIGATVSVIGLGRVQDPDAPLLRMIAEKTGGRVYFTNDLATLPQLFALETITVSRSGYLNEKTKAEVLPDLNLILPVGDVKEPPVCDGYNVTCLRRGANCALMTTGEDQVPMLAFWGQGTGRVAALTVPAAGTAAASFLTWPHYDALMVSLVRYLSRKENPEFFLAARREGTRGEVVLEVDPQNTSQIARLSDAKLLVSSAEGGCCTARLREEAPGRFTASFPLQQAGVYLTTIQCADGSAFSGPSLALPYSPEYAPQRDPEQGRKTLQEIADMTGGCQRVSWEAIYEGGGGLLLLLPVIVPLIVALLMLHLAEIALRRLGSFLPQVATSFEKIAAQVRAVPLPTLAARIRRRGPRRRKTKETAPQQAPEAAAGAQKAPPGKPSVFKQAAQRAQARLKRPGKEQ